MSALPIPIQTNPATLSNEDILESELLFTSTSLLSLDKLLELYNISKNELDNVSNIITVIDNINTKITLQIANNILQNVDDFESSIYSQYIKKIDNITNLEESLKRKCQQTITFYFKLIYKIDNLTLSIITNTFLQLSKNYIINVKDNMENLKIYQDIIMIIFDQINEIYSINLKDIENDIIFIKNKVLNDIRKHEIILNIVNYYLLLDTNYTGLTLIFDQIVPLISISSTINERIKNHDPAEHIGKLKNDLISANTINTLKQKFENVMEKFTEIKSINNLIKTEQKELSPDIYIMSIKNKIENLNNLITEYIIGILNQNIIQFNDIIKIINELLHNNDILNIWNILNANIKYYNIINIITKILDNYKIIMDEIEKKRNKGIFNIFSPSNIPQHILDLNEKYKNAIKIINDINTNINTIISQCSQNIFKHFNIPKNKTSLKEFMIQLQSDIPIDGVELQRLIATDTDTNELLLNYLQSTLNDILKSHNLEPL